MSENKNITNTSIEEDKIKYLCEIVKRQTDYTDEQIIEKLKIHNNNALEIIKEYMNVQPKKEKIINSTNQMVYNEIRNFMDKGPSSR